MLRRVAHLTNLSRATRLTLDKRRCAMGRHVAIFSILNPGHVYPTLGLCVELTRRGHRVTYPTTERFSQQLRQSGAEPVVIKIPELTNAEAIFHYPESDDPKFWHVVTSLFWP